MYQVHSQLGALELITPSVYGLVPQIFLELFLPKSQVSPQT